MHQHLVVLDHRLVDVLELQDFRRAVIALNDRFQGVPPLPML